MKKTFLRLFLLTLILLSIPILRNYKILRNPATTWGFASTQDIIDRVPEIRIFYFVEGKQYQILVLSEFVQNRFMKILYNKDNPQEATLANVFYWYAAKYMIIPFFLYFVAVVLVIVFKNRE